MKIENIIKLILSMLFLICLFDMPYGYFQLVRFLGMLGFLILAYISYKNEFPILVIVYIALAVLLQPIIKIHLGRSIWNIVDVILAVFLISSIFYKKIKL
jgi:FtsH-binding integral membrane protein